MERLSRVSAASPNPRGMHACSPDARSPDRRGQGSVVAINTEYQNAIARGRAEGLERGRERGGGLAFAREGTPNSGDGSDSSSERTSAVCAERVSAVSAVSTLARGSHARAEQELE
eukprot:4940299-Pleurochrysis_carterae.AAC.1